jgi:hypothetical protein
MMIRGTIRWIELPGVKGRRIPLAVLEELVERGKRGGWALPTEVAVKE